MNLTRRELISLWLGAIAIAGLFTFATHDRCWTGAGYGSCVDLVNSQVTK